MHVHAADCPRHTGHLRLTLPRPPLLPACRSRALVLTRPRLWGPSLLTTPQRPSTETLFALSLVYVRSVETPPSWAR
eukprot:364469-Chlamydomonas_euryale.AAC.12